MVGPRQWRVRSVGSGKSAILGELWKFLRTLLPTSLPVCADIKASPPQQPFQVMLIKGLWWYLCVRVCVGGGRWYTHHGKDFCFSPREALETSTFPNTSQKRPKGKENYCLERSWQWLGISPLGPGLVPLWRSIFNSHCQRLFLLLVRGEEIGEEIKAQKWKTKNSWRSDKQFSYAPKHKHFAKLVTPNASCF